VLEAVCRAFAVTEWGAALVDVTEVLLTLTLHRRPVTWPTLDSLLATRKVLLSEVSGLSSKQREQYPDVPISEELFMRLPLWDDKSADRDPLGERSDMLRRWIFRVLLCFDKEAMPQPPAVRGKLPGNSVNDVISARRLFSYLGVGPAPMVGFQRMLKLLLPTVQGTTQDLTEVRVRDIWEILFSCKGRPAQARVQPPEVNDFCRELLGIEADVPDSPVEGETPSPSAPVEDSMMPFDETALVKHPAVFRGLCTHGGLLCYKKVLNVLFADENDGPKVCTSAEVADVKALASLVPVLPPKSESPVVSEPPAEQQA